MPLQQAHQQLRSKHLADLWKAAKGNLGRFFVGNALIDAGARLV